LRLRHISERKGIGLKKIKLGICIVVLSVVFAAVLPSVAFADAKNELSIFAETGYFGDENDTFAPPESPSLVHIPMDTSTSTFRGDVTQYWNRMIGNINLYYTYILDSDSLVYNKVEFSINSKVDLTDFETLRFGMCLFGSEVSELKTTITITTDVEEYSSSLYVSTIRWNLMNIDISNILGNISRISVKVDLSDDASCTSMYISEPFAEAERSARFVSLDRYLTNSFENHFGNADIEYGNISADVRGRAHFSARLGTFTKLKIGSTAYFQLKNDGFNSASVRVGIRYSQADEYVYTPEIAVLADDDVITFPFTVEGEITGYIVEYNNVRDGDGFKLRGVTIYPENSDRIEAKEALGWVDSITRDEDKILFRGGLERSTVSDYAGSMISFCAIPGSVAGDISKAVVLDSVKITTTFEYTADLSAKPASADTYMFFVAIAAENKELIPISVPKYADSGVIPERNLSTLGLYGSVLAGVFESNASHVIVDIPLDRLLVGDGAYSSTAASYVVYGEDGNEASVRTIGFDRNILSAIDSDVQFYTSAGIKVYLRITSSSPIEGLTYLGEGENYGIRLVGEASRSRYAAIIRFLSKRYSTSDGFIIGKSVNDASMLGNVAFENITAYANSLADICRITYNAASVNNSDVLVIVPFSSSSDDGDHLSVSERSLAVILSEKLGYLGDIPWVMMSMLETSAKLPTVVKYLDKIADAFGSNTPVENMVFYAPSEEALTTAYESYKLTRSPDDNDEVINYADFIAQKYYELCLACEEYNPRAVFLSTLELRSGYDRELYYALKNHDNADSGRYIAVFPAVNTESLSPDESAVPMAEYTVWDFTDKHYSLGWITGGGTSSCATEYSELFSSYNGLPSRVLRTAYEMELDGNGESLGVSGILLRNFNTSLDLSGVDSLKFRFAVTPADTTRSNDNFANDSSAVTVVFVVGSNDRRAEFTAESITMGGVQEFVCDLSAYEYAYDVSYIGIMVYASRDVYFDLASVTSGSRTFSAEELNEIFSEEAKADIVPAGDMRFVALIIGVVVLATAIVGVSFTKREREEREQRKVNETASRRSEGGRYEKR